MVDFYFEIRYNTKYAECVCIIGGFFNFKNGVL
jgi:hypothetical protein